MRYQIRLNEPTTGHLEVPRNSAEASQISIAKVIRIAYRGRYRGGFFVENISDPEVQENEVDEWLSVKGRGGLVILDEAVVWYSAQGETKRTFTSQPAAAMLIALIDEAQTRGCFPSLSYSFSATHDSEGNPWNDSRTLNFRVNTSLLDITRKISTLGIDFEMDYEWESNYYTLHAYRDGRGSDKSSTIVFVPGKNCTEVTTEEAAEELRNVYLLEYAQGSFTSVEDATSISNYRRKEKGLNVGQATNDTQAEAFGQDELDENKDPKKNIRIEVDDHVDPMVFVDYDVGDWVGYYNRAGSFNKYRLRGITLDWGEDKRFASVVLELSSIKQELEIRNAKSLAKLGSGLASDRSDPANDVVDSINTHNNDPNAHPHRDEFIELEDTPSAYTGSGGKTLIVNGSEDGLVFETAPKNNYSAVTDPGATDDSDDGYEVGSRWINTDTDEAFICVDATVGSAIWVQTTSEGTVEFIGLTDTPSSYTGQASDSLQVNSAEDALILIKNNFSASSAPGVNDDDSAGYSVSSRWVDLSADKEYVCLDASTGAAVWLETTVTASSGTDGDAIHDNVAGEINAITEKTTPVNADLIVIEDSEDSYNKKKVQAGNLPGGGGSSGAMTLIETIEGDGTFASHTFSIPSAIVSAYSHLILFSTTKSGAGLRMQVGGGGTIDSGNNYFRRSEERGNYGSAIEWSDNTNQWWLGRYISTGNISGGISECRIMGAFQTSIYKNMRGHAHQMVSTSDWRLNEYWGTWKSTLAINVVKVFHDNSTNMPAGEIHSIYAV